MRVLLSLLLFASITLVVGLRDVAADTPPAFIVIVNAENRNVALDRELVADAFLKKTTRWPNGDVIKPVDLPGSSPVRERFSDAVLKRSVAAVKSYWQQMIFSGRDVPPIEVATDDEVIKFVGAHTGAIGYVSGTAHLGDTKAVTVRP